MTVILPVQFGIGRLHFKVTNDPEEMIMTCGFEAATGVSTQACADLWYNSYLAAHAASGMDNGYTFVKSSVTLMQPGGLQIAAKGPAVPGTNASVNPLPNNCALLITKNTGFSARKLRGRWYQPPFNFDENNVDRNGVLQAASVTTLQTRWNSFFTAITGGPTILTLRVLHSDATTPTVISSFTVQPQMATQRKRMRK